MSAATTAGSSCPNQINTCNEQPVENSRAEIKGWCKNLVPSQQPCRRHKLCTAGHCVPPVNSDHPSSDLHVDTQDWLGPNFISRTKHILQGELIKVSFINNSTFNHKSHNWHAGELLSQSQHSGFSRGSLTERWEYGNKSVNQHLNGNRCQEKPHHLREHLQRR